MKKSAISLFTISSFLMACAFISFGVSAHPGHDHSHWFSELHHVLGSVVVVTGLSIALYYFLKTNRQAASKKSKEDR